MPQRASEILILRCQNVKMLEKIALRALKRRPMTIENRDFSLWLLKSEDPAKMTHSIPDFVSRNKCESRPLFGLIVRK